MDSSRQACSRAAPELSSSWDPAAFAGPVTRLASVAPCDSTIPPYRRLVIGSFYPSGCTYLLLLCPASTTTVMSTPASATTPFTVPWGRGTGRRAGVLLTVSPSSFSCGFCHCYFRLCFSNCFIYRLGGTKTLPAGWRGTTAQVPSASALPLLSRWARASPSGQYHGFTAM